MTASPTEGKPLATARAARAQESLASSQSPSAAFAISAGNSASAAQYAGARSLGIGMFCVSVGVPEDRPLRAIEA